MELRQTEDAIKDASSIIDKWMKYQVKMRVIPAASVCIVSDNKILFEKHYGYADIESARNSNDKTTYRIASISKLFTAIATMQLAEKGKVSLDDRIQKYLPWFKSKSDNRLSDITIRHLLTHCSGLSREAGTDYWNDDKFPALGEIISFVQGMPTVFPVLERFKYSNLGYGILGEVIKSIAGISYEQYVKKNIIEPLGLKNTHPDFSTEINTLASGYSRYIPEEKREKFPNAKTNSLASATGFISNAEDLGKFLMALMEGSDLLLTDNSKKEMRRIQWVKDDNTNWGIGYEISKVNNEWIFGHGGGFQGFITNVGFEPRRKVGIVVLTNSIDGAAAWLSNSIFQVVMKLIDNYAGYTDKGEINNSVLGLYENRWSKLHVAKINKQLVFHDLRDSDFDFLSLKFKEKNRYTIEGNDGFWNIGEDFRFILNSKGKVEKVLLGPSVLLPVNK